MGLGRGSGGPGWGGTDTNVKRLYGLQWNAGESRRG